ncbi:hypothetical protein ANCCAN_04790 [Ancylostoma caninum]|uniref:Uncharacterized protein n=1 Tax=Ancylostoma caninum TaxID=29170 RepID=A0A368H1V3_ANCCA|nr:hypothetical protein ANCCAN_04790 [Ancylostoma caninum]
MGTFEYITCNRFPKAQIFPFCVYIVEPSTKTQASKMHYGCMYAEDLPQKCVDHKDYYFPSVAVTIHGEKWP